jgi:hypothetical protein
MHLEKGHESGRMHLDRMGTNTKVVGYFLLRLPPANQLCHVKKARGQCSRLATGFSLGGICFRVAHGGKGLLRVTYPCLTGKRFLCPGWGLFGERLGSAYKLASEPKGVLFDQERYAVPISATCYPGNGGL